MEVNPIVNAPDEALVCYCANVTKGQILKAIRSGSRSLQKVKDATGACPKVHDCKKNNPLGRCCSREIMALLRVKPL